jgi:hypothetical protein
LLARRQKRGYLPRFLSVGARTARTNKNILVVSS